MIFNCSPSEFKKISEFTVTTQIENTPTGEFLVTDSLKIKGGYGVGVSVSEDTLLIGVDEATFPNGLLPEGGGSGLPEVTEADNGKIPMVVGGQWENVSFPAGAQYYKHTVFVHADSWNDNGSMIHAVVYGFDKNLEGCHVGVSISASATKEEIIEATRCGVMGRTGEGTEVVLEALWAMPTIALPFDFIITKPTTLAYSVDEDSMTLTIVEGGGNE